MGGCLSFKDPREPLGVHLHLAAGMMEGLFLRRGYHLRLDGLPPEEGKRALLLAAILHDIGKGHSAFQRRGSFPGHELYSGYVVHAISPLSDTEWNLALASAVALHHHTMIGRVVDERFSLEPGCLDDVREVLRSFEFSLSLEDVEDISPGREEIWKWLEGIRDWIRSPVNLRRAYLILYPLMVSDNMAASIRGGGTLLGRELMSTYLPVRLYGDVCDHPWLRREICREVPAEALGERGRRDPGHPAGWLQGG